MNHGQLVDGPRRRRVAAVTGVLLLSSLLVALAAAPAGAVIFPNPSAMTIPGVGTGPGQASLYPSPITVSGLGAVADVNVRLLGVTHTFPDDLDVLVVGPTGVKVVVMSDAGGDVDISGRNFTFDDAAAASLPDATQLFSGTYRPTTFGAGFVGTPPAPAGPYATVLSAFNGTSPNGTWNLFVFDDASADSGSMASGWSLEITTAPTTITSFAPTSGVPGTPVTITGTSFGAATSVTFGGVVAPFTVNSQTQITATVPDGAVSGPIAVVTTGGTAVSATSFTVVSLEHGRDVSLRVGRKARGTVTVDDAFAACASEVPVKVQRRLNGRWRLVGTDTTSATGVFVVPGTRDPGTYRAIALRVTLASNDICLKAISTPVSH
jgi:subtilisin-like proprotein convertase family protein